MAVIMDEVNDLTRNGVPVPEAAHEAIQATCAIPSAIAIGR